jgi:hypothetical protein
MTEITLLACIYLVSGISLIFLGLYEKKRDKVTAAILITGGTVLAIISLFSL